LRTRQKSRKTIGFNGRSLYQGGKGGEQGIERSKQKGQETGLKCRGEMTKVKKGAKKKKLKGEIAKGSCRHWKTASAVKKKNARRQGLAGTG